MPKITVQGIGEGIILSGSVSSPQEAEQAQDIAGGLFGPAARMFRRARSSMPSSCAAATRSLLQLASPKFERDGRSKAASASIYIRLVNYGSALVELQPTPIRFRQWSIAQPVSAITPACLNSCQRTLQAMEQAGVIHTLAEPNLTAISENRQTFVAGGEFHGSQGYSCSTASAGRP